MNQTALKTIVFFAEFTPDGFLTEQSRSEFESCLEKASNWEATLRIVAARPVSELASPVALDYDNSTLQRARRRADYVLSGLTLRAEEKGVSAEAGVVYGAVGVELARNLGRDEGLVVWSEFASPSA